PAPPQWFSDLRESSLSSMLSTMLLLCVLLFISFGKDKILVHRWLLLLHCLDLRFFPDMLRYAAFLLLVSLNSVSSSLQDPIAAVMFRFRSDPAVCDGLGVFGSKGPFIHVVICHRDCGT
ncbi:hypothetical protein A2U01_0015991, partial [Trifolium medium]|nr:hypothetical protein [Trifolium medium]